ncbi:MAG: hypothetical protein JST68_13430 [Bacteroidetes bacterium]|nr:hypothetical protein [Bacteroidota bacterium]
MSKIGGLLFILIIVASRPSHAQLISYNKDGNRIKYGKESTTITIQAAQTPVNVRSTATPLSLPSLLPGVIGAGFSIAKVLIAQQQEKYTATYAASKTGIGLLFLTDTASLQSAALNIKIVEIERLMDAGKTAMRMTLVPAVEPHTGLFRFRVDSLFFPYSKAKIKKWGKYGKTVDISVDIKLEAYYKEIASGSSGNRKNPVSDTVGFTLKNSVLGESTILLSGIAPTYQETVALDNSHYSGWFQTLPTTAIPFANVESDWKTGWYTLTITVKEANPYGITSKQRSDFFSATSGDLSTLLKSFVPSK